MRVQAPPRGAGVAVALGLASLVAAPLHAQEPPRGSCESNGTRWPLDLVIAVDVSGSMAGRKIDVTRQAIKRLSRRLRKKDRFGLVAFSTQARILHPLGPASNREMIDSSIAKLEPEGGTSILVALERSSLIFEHARDRGRRRCHVVLISDGQSAQEGLSERVRKMRHRGITISCLAMGGSADERLLRMISKEGDGRFHKAGRLKQILPKLVSEARKLGR